MSRVGLGANAGPDRSASCGRRRGTSTCPTSSPPPSGSPSAAASPARTSTQFGFDSQRKAKQAWAEGRFDREISPDRGAGARREQAADAERALVSRDQGLRDTTLEGLAQPEAGDRGWHPHRGHVVADLRRRRRGAVDGRGQGQGARAAGHAPASSARRSSARSRTTTSTARCSRRPRCWRRPG